MAYVALTSKSPGDTYTAAEHNQLRDNLIASVPDVFTTKGDIAVATAADAASRLGVGANDTVLTAASGETTGLKWSAGPNSIYASYNTNTDQTAGTGAAYLIDFEDKIFDTDSAVTVGAAWKFTVPTDHDGYYLVCACVYLESSAAWGVNEYAQLWLYKNNAADTLLGSLYMHAAGTYNVSVNGSTIVSLAATDYIDVRLLQNSGSNAILDGAVPTANWVAIARVF